MTTAVDKSEPWKCPHCGQLNSEWSQECGRCETNPPTMLRKVSDERITEMLDLAESDVILSRVNRAPRSVQKYSKDVRDVLRELQALRLSATARDDAMETIMRVTDYMPEGHHKESIRNTINAVRT